LKTQYEAKQEEIDSAQAQLDELNAKLAETTNEEEKSSLEKEIASVQANLESLQKEYDDLYIKASVTADIMSDITTWWGEDFNLSYDERLAYTQQQYDEAVAKLNAALATNETSNGGENTNTVEADTVTPSTGDGGALYAGLAVISIGSIVGVSVLRKRYN